MGAFTQHNALASLVLWLTSYGQFGPVADEPSYLTDMEDVKRKETLTLECGTADGERSVPEYVGSTSWVRAAGQRSMPCASVQIAFRGPPVTPQLGGPHTTYYMPDLYGKHTSLPRVFRIVLSVPLIWRPWIGQAGRVTTGSALAAVDVVAEEHT
ncbi:hypothetical protein B0T24DRAFT_593517 [Lasiosphaeria ovina]|uniref:Ig-like domain-containing protein n=1 Tax=Lasiosphaeria ovina TaxID=92902 RepID=A0AAE0KAR4_9PEZI|nr:hypothetical protein B0T24DRAFT_593517 [Lasiosphaeria ovina]